MFKQESIDYKPAMERLRVEATLTREIGASPDRIFPLVCPVEELRWIPDWKYELVYTQSGVNETDCIFIENKSGQLLFDTPVPTTWVTLIHDPQNKKVLFLLNLDGRAVIRFDLRIQAVGSEVSRILLKMRFTAIDQETDTMPAETIQEKLELILTMLAEWLKHYCETGHMK